MLCASADEGDIKVDELAHRGFAEILGNAVAALLQITQDYVENDYQIVTKETKCFLRGDSYGEMVMYFHPKDKEQEGAKEETAEAVAEEKTDDTFTENIDWE